MPTSVYERLVALERVVANQQKEIARLKTLSTLDRFVSPSIAAKVLNLSIATIRKRINHAKAFPEESPYKEGIHWKQQEIPSLSSGGPSIRYHVNIEEWIKV